MEQPSGVLVQLEPTEEQEELLRKNCGCARFIYNFFLEQTIKYYEQTGGLLNRYLLEARIPWLLKEFDFLKEIDRTSIYQVLQEFGKAQNYQRLVVNKEVPNLYKFKSYDKGNSFKCTDRIHARKLRSTRGEILYLQVGKHGWIEFRGDPELLVGSKFESITVSTRNEKWYAYCKFKDETVNREIISTGAIDGQRSEEA